MPRASPAPGLAVPVRVRGTLCVRVRRPAAARRKLPRLAPASRSVLASVVKIRLRIWGTRSPSHASASSPDSRASSSWPSAIRACTCDRTVTPNTYGLGSPPSSRRAIAASASRSAASGRSPSARSISRSAPSRSPVSCSRHARSLREIASSHASPASTESRSSSSSRWSQSGTPTLPNTRQAARRAKIRRSRSADSSATLTASSASRRASAYEPEKKLT